jgi:hypothetical protein
VEFTPIKNKHYTRSPDLASVAEDLIASKPLTLGPARIAYLLVYPSVTPTTAARCVLANNHLQFFAGVDYIIEVSGDLWESLDDDTRAVLVYHELLHVLPLYNAKKDTWSYRLRDHDLQDFSEIIREYGLDWLTTLRNTFNSTYDIDPEKAEGMHL